MEIISNEVEVKNGIITSSVIWKDNNGVVNQTIKTFSQGLKILDVTEQLAKIDFSVSVQNEEKNITPNVNVSYGNILYHENEDLILPEQMNVENNILVEDCVPCSTQSQQSLYQEKREGKIEGRKQYKKWTPEEEKEVFKKFFDGKPIAEIAKESPNRGYNAIYMRLLKMKEYFLSNDPKQYSHLEDEMLGHGVSREVLSRFINDMNLPPLKNYKKT